MEGIQVEQDKPQKKWRYYLASAISILLLVLAIIATVYFREEIENAKAYGYAGVFFVGILCGITIIPAPTLLLVFTLGNVLKPVFGPEYMGPVYVGLVAGLGGAIGGITVYLTGAGVGTIFSKLSPADSKLDYQSREKENVERKGWTKFWFRFLSRSQALYNRMTEWIGGKGGAWTLFISSAMIISPFYFAGLAAGSLHMGLLRFFLISWAGKTVRYLTVAFAGYWGLNVILKWIGA